MNKRSPPQAFHRCQKDSMVGVNGPLPNTCSISIFQVRRRSRQVYLFPLRKCSLASRNLRSQLIAWPHPQIHSTVHTTMNHHDENKSEVLWCLRGRQLPLFKYRYCTVLTPRIIISTRQTCLMLIRPPTHHGYTRALAVCQQHLRDPQAFEASGYPPLASPQNRRTASSL